MSNPPSPVNIAMNTTLFQLLMLLTKGDPQKIVQKHIVQKNGRAAIKELNDMICHKNISSMGNARKRVEEVSFVSGEDPRTIFMEFDRACEQCMKLNKRVNLNDDERASIILAKIDDSELLG